MADVPDDDLSSLVRLHNERAAAFQQLERAIVSWSRDGIRQLAEAVEGGRIRLVDGKLKLGAARKARK